ncbi:hypothetical protein K9M09_00265 [Patescibacteria group bacterium]|nr:hypothetical protein [Patescibacteria group bacterium]
MIWINFFHLYQPANSPIERIQEAVDKSYARLARLMLEHPHLKFTANISGCLLERLQESSSTAIINDWRTLLKSGRLELVGSAAYHAFLPFIDEEEIRYQIKRQEELTWEILGVDIKQGGFFLPEMAYTPALGKLIKNLGYKWLILDEASLPDTLTNPQTAYIDANSGLSVLVRQREFSNAYAPDLINDLAKVNKLPQIIVTATDAELYGLRHEDPSAELEKMVKIKDLQTNTISDYLDTLDKLPSIKFQSASWETNWQHDQKQPFAIWKEKGNKTQTLLWDLAALALKAGKKFKNDNNYAWYRWHLSRGLASCSFWWASGRNFSHNFGPIAWNPDEVENGLNDLLRSLRSLEDKRSLKYKIKAEKLASDIKKSLWTRHWSDYWLNTNSN